MAYGSIHERRHRPRGGGAVPHDIGTVICKNLGYCNVSKSIGGGGAEGEKCSGYHQNLAKIRFLFRFDSLFCHHCGDPDPSKKIYVVTLPAPAPQ